MTRHNWKGRERQVADFFVGLGRNPLSGENSGHTSSDTLSPVFFIEVKSPKTSAIWTLFLKTRQLAKVEDKIPVLATTMDHQEGFLVTLHSSDFVAVATILYALRSLRDDGELPSTLKGLSTAEKRRTFELFEQVRNTWTSLFPKTPTPPPGSRPSDSRTTAKGPSSSADGPRRPRRRTSPSSAGDAGARRLSSSSLVLTRATKPGSRRRS